MSSTKYSGALQRLLITLLAIICVFVATPALAQSPSPGNPAFTSGITNSAGAVSIWFQCSNATAAIVHYTIAGLQQNYNMTASGSTFTYPITASAGTQVTLQFTYTVGGTQYTSTSGVQTVPSASGAGTVATPTFSPAAGTYTSAQTVTISDSTSGAKIYYTTNGTTPTTSSTLYTGAITVSSTETIEAIAVATGDTNSSVASAAYTINSAVAATPVFSPAAGTYTSAQTVTITDSTSGAKIYYTTNGTTPTTSSTLYSGAISVSSTETLEAIAVATGDTNSSVASAAYTINATSTFTQGVTDNGSSLTVWFTPNPSSSLVILSYVLNGGGQQNVNMTASNGTYTYSVPVTAGAAATLNTYYFTYQLPNGTQTTTTNYSWTRSAVAATPVFSPAAGTYTSAQTVTITDATSGAKIYYTTNGTTPTTSSTLYSGAITVSSTETLEAMAVATGYSNSSVASAAYTINSAVAATPVFSPAAGTYASAQTVTITDSTSGAKIYFTTNGTTPTTSSTLYSGAISVSSTETLEAMAVATGYSNSSVSSAAYVINTTGNGSFTQGVSPSGGSNYQIWFTPTWTVPANSTMEVIYQIISPTGTAGTQQGVALNAPVAPSTSWTYSAVSAPPGSTISYYFNYYSPAAGGPVLAPTTAPSQPYTYLVCANQALAGCPTPIGAPTANPPAGVYAPNTVPFNVTLSSSTSGATIYYTTNGTYPTTTSTKYTAPIQITASESINAIAVLTSTGQQSNESMSAYAIQTPCTTGPTGACIVATPYFIGNQPNSSSSPYTTQIGVNMLNATPGALIYYTITRGATGTTPVLTNVTAQPPLANLGAGTASPVTSVFVPSSIWLNNSGGNSTWTIEAVAVKNGQTSSVLTGTFTVNASATTSTPWNGNVTINVANNTGQQVNWFIYGRESLADANGDGGSYCGNFVVVVPPPAGSPAGTVATLADVAPGVPPPYNPGEAPALTVGTTNPDVYFDWAYPAGTTSFVVPPVCSGRIYFSTGSKPLLNAVNVILNPGAGAPPNDYGWTNPSLNSPTDPNQGVAFDYGEFDTAPLRTCTLAPASCRQAPGIWADTTRVDLFSLPIQVEVTGEDGFDAITGETLTETSAQLRALYLASVPPAFQELEGPLSILNPSNDPSFNTIGGANATYLDPYIQSVWNQLASTPVTLNLNGYAPLTCQEAGGVVTCNPGGFQIPQPNTFDVLPCNSAIGADPGELGAIEAQFCAALNRHVADQSFSNWWNPMDFYSAAPTNYYAQFFHLHAWDGLSYGFAYDDVGGLSSTIFTYSPTTVTYTIGK